MRRNATPLVVRIAPYVRDVRTYAVRAMIVTKDEQVRRWAIEVTLR